MDKEQKYKVHKIIYTDSRGKRTNAFVAEESSKIALELLEDSLINFGYTPKNLEKMIPLVKTTEFFANKTWIKFREITSK